MLAIGRIHGLTGGPLLLTATSRLAHDIERRCE